MLIAYYDPQTFERKGTITRAKSAMWKKKFYTYGSFEIQLHNCDIQVNDLIMQGSHNGIVTSVIKNIPNGITVKGYDMKGLSEFRYVENGYNTQATPEKIYKDIAKTYFATSSRTIVGLTIAPDRGTGVQFAYTTKARWLSDLFEDLGKQTGMGYDINFNGSEIVFDIVTGKNNTGVVFSREKRSIESAEYTHSIENTYNVAYYTDDKGTISYSGTEKGILRREGYTEKSSDVTNYLTEKKEIENIEATAARKYVYGTDYFLGDIVTVKVDDVSIQKTVTEVEFSYTQNGLKIYPTFGEKRVNPLKKILKG